MRLVIWVRFCFPNMKPQPVDLLLGMNPSFSRKSGWPTGRESSLCGLQERQAPLLPLFPAVSGSYPAFHIHVHGATWTQSLPATKSADFCAEHRFHKLLVGQTSGCSWGMHHRGAPERSGILYQVSKLSKHDKSLSSTKLNMLTFWGEILNAAIIHGVIFRSNQHPLVTYY